MGFIGINDQNKQRINISKSAYATLEMDAKDFHLSSKDALINRIILYIEHHQLTTDDYLNEYKAKLIGDFSDISPNHSKNDLVSKLVERKASNVRKRNSINSTHKRNQKGFYMRISKNARRWLESEKNTEDLYYSSLEQYINVKIEEYVNKTNYERECIIFDELIGNLSMYIREKLWLDIYNPERNTVSRVYPIVINTDSMSTHAYLACYQLTDEEMLKPLTYRISALSSEVVPIKGYDRSVSNEEYKNMDEMIRERGIQFLATPAVDIEVKLNTYGIRSYERTLPLRPDYISIRPAGGNSSDAIYTFHCTEKQAEYYFFRFGRDAQIISPPELRNRFISLYEDTLLRYNNTGKE